MKDKNIIDLIDNRLAPPKNMEIFDGSITITIKVREHLRNYKEPEIKKLFRSEKPSKGVFLTHKTEFCCHKCSTKYFKNLSKTAVIGTIFQIDCCEKCSSEIENERSKRYELEKEQWKIQSNEQTDEFINNYLNPNHKFNSENLKKSEWFYFLFNKLGGLNKEKLFEYASTMNYKSFLNTPYWQAVRQKVLKKWNYKCALCSSNENLNIHHRSYENKGRELVNQNDLICLCNNCHSTFHENEK